MEEMDKEHGRGGGGGGRAEEGHTFTRCIGSRGGFRIPFLLLRKNMLHYFLVSVPQNVGCCSKEGGFVLLGWGSVVWLVYLFIF